MVVAAAEHAQDTRDEPDRPKVGPHLPERRTQHGADKYNVAAALFARELAEAAELSVGSPVVRIGRHTVRIRRPPQSEQNNRPPAFPGGLRNGERQRSTPADDRQWAFANRSGGHLAHGISPVSAR